MTHKISVHVRADIGRDTIDLFVSGCLNSATAEVLARHVAQARRLDPAAPILVDLSSALHVDPIALEQLRSAVDATRIEGYKGRIADVEFRLPQALEACEPADAPERVAEPSS